MCNKKPEIRVFAGPNGSGKSTITSLAALVGDYINADNIKSALNCSDIEAAKLAERQREEHLATFKNFTFETVLSTDRNLNLLKRAKEKGYFIKCFYILTANPTINIGRIASRVLDGGHDVPIDKVKSRYYKALNLLPTLIDICDVIHIYDNSAALTRIFKKRKNEFYYWENEFWDKTMIEDLTKIKFSNSNEKTNLF